MKYSIITVNYNNRDGLRKTIESVVNQTCRDLEYIVIDGGSTDGSKEVILEYQDKIDYWVSEPDKGIYHAMNKGTKAAHGEYLNFMNSGDCFYDSNVLMNMKEHLLSDIVEGRLLNLSTNSFPFKPESEQTMMFFYSSNLDHQATFIRRQLLIDTPYDENLKIVSDWKFFLKKIIFENASFRSIPVNVARYEGMGVSAKELQLQEAERQQVLAELLPPGILCDYKRYAGKESPMLDLIPQFNRTRGLNMLILQMVKTALKVYHVFHPMRK